MNEQEKEMNETEMLALVGEADARDHPQPEAPDPSKDKRPGLAGIDESIAPMIKALNDGGIKTVASCSGHGKRPGTIALADGRELIVTKDFDEARAIDDFIDNDLGKEAVPFDQRALLVEFINIGPYLGAFKPSDESIDAFLAEHPQDEAPPVSGFSLEQILQKARKVYASGALNYGIACANTPENSSIDKSVLDFSRQLYEELQKLTPKAPKPPAGRFSIEQMKAAIKELVYYAGDQELAESWGEDFLGYLTNRKKGMEKTTPETSSEPPDAGMSKEPDDE